MSVVHLSAPRLTREGDQFTVSCTAKIPGRNPEELWVTSDRDGVTDRADAFVALSLLPAMKLGVPLVSDAPVSRVLLESGLPQIQKIHHLWRRDKWNSEHPEFQSVQVRAEAIDDLSPVRSVGSFYSGGVDSSFSLIDSMAEITDLIFIRDFESRFKDDAAKQAIAGVVRVAAARNKRLIIAQSNGRDVFGDLVSWAHYHGGFLAAIALQLQHGLGKVHIPSSHSVQHLPIWGSHPLVDPLWSTGALRVVHDRVDVSRVEKTIAIAHDAILLDNLRVCWSPVHNCGVCSKCVRTLLTLQVAGLYEYGRPFRRPPVTPNELQWMDLRQHYEFFQEIEEYCFDIGTSPEVVKALRRAHSGWPHRLRKTTWQALSATRSLAAARRARELARWPRGGVLESVGQVHASSPLHARSPGDPR